MLSHKKMMNGKEKEGGGAGTADFSKKLGFK